MKNYIRVKTHFILLIIGLLGLAACRPGAAPVPGVSTDIVITYQREGGSPASHKNGSYSQMAAS